MSREFANWFSVSSPDKRMIICADCRGRIELSVPFLDHHPGICRICKIECAYLDWKGRKVQIISQNAPPELAKMLRYLQENFDALDYVELLCSFEEIADALK
jgi:hypothetical protein